ncbi:glutaredoxin 2 isoform X1 [Carcharodon carcharias]|uniref:glutaredoxin 2 isoform X1 n=2 Tax=Carcharodon carcharias TaxID=13397 RepID=UPI001B7F556A|nr:glutaredoxin 2 isoform X1 [Carcharodon carcharias]
MKRRSVSALTTEFLPFVRMGQFFTRLPEAHRDAALHFIRNQVVQNCVVIFSKTYCPYCMKAKSIFEEIGANFKAIELDQRKDGDHIQNTLEELTGIRTVPRVFVNGKCIGGAMDTHKLHSSGKLLPLVLRCSPPCKWDESYYLHRSH